MLLQYTVAQTINCIIVAYNNCLKCNLEWAAKHLETLKWIEKQFLPHGSGFDSGTKIIIDDCDENEIVLDTNYHHMNDNGMYDGWTEHKVVIKPDWRGVSIKITGKDKNGIKEYMYEVFDQALNEICHEIDGERNEYGWYFDGKWTARK